MKKSKPEGSIMKEQKTERIKLSEQLPHVFLYSKGYEAIANIASHDATNLYSSYLTYQKNIASSITQQQTQITFIQKFIKPI